MVTTADFPQADRLEQVGKVAIAIAKGYRADAEIESFIGCDSAGRQGRYYRLAAEVLGLVINTQNMAVLTPLGEEFATLVSDASRLDFLGRCLVETPVFHEALCYIHQYRPSDGQLKQWFRTFYPGATSTADRRFHTFMCYLRDARLLQQDAHSNRLTKYLGSVVKKTEVAADSGLTGRQVKLLPTSAPAMTSSIGMLHMDVEIQKRERANLIHWQLVDAKSSFLDTHGFVPYCNTHIDLFTGGKGETIFYEMKSIAGDDTNLLSQVRKAVAQLYEYRYIYQQLQARLCIVTNRRVCQEDSWLLDYLARDRAIAYEWTEDFSCFSCRDDARSLLGDFAP